jgi:hypothetical protein
MHVIPMTMRVEDKDVAAGLEATVTFSVAAG